MRFRSVILVAALSAGCTATDRDAEVEIEFQSFRSSCIQCPGTWRMPSMLTVAVTSTEATSVRIEWLEFYRDGGIQFAWNDPIAAVELELSRDESVVAELRETRQQCSPVNAVSQGRFVLTMNGEELEVEGPAEFVSDPAECG